MERIEALLRLTENRRTGIVGLSGSGKSWLANFLLDALPPEKSALVIDSQRKKDYDSLISYGTIRKWEHLKSYLATEGFRSRVRVRFVIEDYSNRVNILESVSKWCLERGNVLLCFDEAAAFRCRQASKGLEDSPSASHFSPSLEQVFAQGRSHGVDVVCVTQRYSSIPISARSQINQVVSYKQISSRDISSLEERFGRRAEMIERLQDHVAMASLPSGRVFYVDPDYTVTPLPDPE